MGHYPLVRTRWNFHCGLGLRPYRTQDVSQRRVLGHDRKQTWAEGYRRRPCRHLLRGRRWWWRGRWRRRLLLLHRTLADRVLRARIDGVAQHQQKQDRDGNQRFFCAWRGHTTTR